MLRLKMMVSSVKRIADSKGEIQAEEIQMSAVYGDKGTANGAWSKWTPSGNLQFTVSNPAAFGQVLPGQYILLDLTPATADA